MFKCSFDEKRLPLSKQFWIAYEKIKVYKPQYKSGRSDITLEKKATNSLKTLLKQKKNDLDQSLISFINTLLKDIKRYKTLPKFTLRKLVMPEKSDGNNYDELINNIENLRRKIGSDYLDIILERSTTIDEDIIIAFENTAPNKV